MEPLHCNIDGGRVVLHQNVFLQTNLSGLYKVKKAECYGLPCDISPSKTINLSESFSEEQKEHQKIVVNPVDISPILSKHANFDHGPDEPTSLFNVNHNPRCAKEEPPSNSPTLTLTQNKPRYPVHDHHVSKHLQDYILF